MSILEGLLAWCNEVYHDWLLRDLQIGQCGEVYTLTKTDRHGNTSWFSVTTDHVAYTCGITGDIVLYSDRLRTTYRKDRFPAIRKARFFINPYSGLWPYLQSVVVVNSTPRYEYFTQTAKTLHHYSE